MKKYKWNARKFLGNLGVLLTLLGVNVLVFWMLWTWVIQGGAA